MPRRRMETNSPLPIIACAPDLHDDPDDEQSSHSDHHSDACANERDENAAENDQDSGPGGDENRSTHHLRSSRRRWKSEVLRRGNGQDQLLAEEDRSEEEIFSTALIELDTVEEAPLDDPSQSYHYPQSDSETDDQHESQSSKRRKTRVTLSSCSNTVVPQTEGNSQVGKLRGDFFESCQVLVDDEFGSRDLLDVYNVAQVKACLSSPGMLIVNVRAASFTLEVINKEPENMVSTGIRIDVGSDAMDKLPQHLEYFGRTVPVNHQHGPSMGRSLSHSGRIHSSREEIQHLRRSITSSMFHLSLPVQLQRYLRELFKEFFTSSEIDCHESLGRLQLTLLSQCLSKENYLDYFYDIQT